MRAIFNYNPETGVAEVTLTRKGITATASAKVHPDDKQYSSEFTGLTIAEMRAYKKLLEKRARQKNKIAKWYLTQAEYYKKLAEEDLDVSQAIQDEIEYYIQSKSDFYEKMKNPIKPIIWSDIEADKLSDNFKKMVEEN